MMSTRLLLRAPFVKPFASLTAHYVRSFSITRIALEPPKKSAPPPPPPPPPPAPKRGGRPKKAPEPEPEPEPEPVKPVRKRRLVLSDKERKQIDKEKERERKEKEKAKLKLRAAKERSKEREIVKKEKEKEKQRLRAEKPYPLPPKRPLSSYLLFYTSRTYEPGLGVSVLSTRAAQEWRELPGSAKEEFQKKQEEARTKYNTEVAQWVSSLNQAQLSAARTNREPGTSSDAALKQLPKRPTNGYALFFAEYLTKQDGMDRVNELAAKTSDGSLQGNARSKIAVAGRLAGEKWRSMSEKEKQPYVNKSEELKKAYNKKYGDVIARQKEDFQTASA